MTRRFRSAGHLKNLRIKGHRNESNASKATARGFLVSCRCSAAHVRSSWSS